MNEQGVGPLPLHSNIGRNLLPKRATSIARIHRSAYLAVLHPDGSNGANSVGLRVQERIRGSHEQTSSHHLRSTHWHSDSPVPDSEVLIGTCLALLQSSPLERMPFSSCGPAEYWPRDQNVSWTFCESEVLNNQRFKSTLGEKRIAKVQNTCNFAVQTATAPGPWRERSDALAWPPSRVQMPMQIRK